MNILSNNYSSIDQMRSQIQGKTNQQAKPIDNHDVIAGKKSFEEILNQKRMDSAVTNLKFSKHANQRLASRNIELTKDQLTRLQTGTMKAKTKGINESLVMVDNLAFVVSVKNSTVITALDNQEEQVFTNIDGAVIM